MTLTVKAKESEEPARKTDQGAQQTAEPAAPQSIQRGTVEGYRRNVSTRRNTNSADDARPEHGALLHKGYSLLSLEEPACNTATARYQGSGDSPEDTTGTVGTYRRETGMRDRNRNYALLACDQLEDKEEEQLPPERQCVLNTCKNQGGEGGGPPTQQCALPVSIQGMEGDTPTK